jgi:hypothetical protein
MDEGLVYTMKQVAAQLAAQGSQDIAIYLKHLAAEIHHGWLQPKERSGRSPISSTPPDRGSIDPELATVSSSRSPNGQIDAPIDPGVAIVNNRHPHEAIMEVATPIPSSAPPSNSQIEELLANISSRLTQMERSINKHSTPPNPLWYMPILEQADTQGWIISSEEVEQLIGIKPHCDSGHNFLMRGCWKFVKVGKVGTNSSWRVVKEIVTLPIEVAPEPEKPEQEAQLSSPWSETN